VNRPLGSDRRVLLSSSVEKNSAIASFFSTDLDNGTFLSSPLGQFTAIFSPPHPEILGFASDFRMRRKELKLNFNSTSSEGRVYTLIYKVASNRSNSI